MLDKLSPASIASPLIVHRSDGSTHGKDPRALSRAELGAAGHLSQPILKVIRTKCLDCSTGSRAEVVAGTAVTCALWPYRLGANPSTKPRGLPYQPSDRSSEKPRKLRMLLATRALPWEGRMSGKFSLLHETVASVRRAGFEPQIKLGRHFKIRWFDDRGQKHTLVVSVSPSDHRAFHNNRALLRRLIRGSV